MKKKETLDEWRAAAANYCAVAERCPSEVKTKLMQWGADEASAGEILRELEQKHFLDEERYCRAFVRDKYRFSGWGRMKIIQALRMKGLCGAMIDLGLAEIDEQEYEEILRTLVVRKRKSVTGRNEYERNAKVIRFMVGRGYRMDEVIRAAKLDIDDGYID